MKICTLIFLLVSLVGCVSKKTSGSENNATYDLANHLITISDSLIVNNVQAYCKRHKLDKRKAIVFLTIRDNGVNKYIYITHSNNYYTDTVDKTLYYSNFNGYLTLCYFGGEDYISDKALSKKQLDRLANEFGIINQKNYSIEEPSILRIQTCERETQVSEVHYGNFIDYIPCGYKINYKNKEFKLEK